MLLAVGLMALGAAWGEIHERSGFFYFNLLWTLAGVVGVFTSLDLFLFFFFWEVMLIPMFFIIAIWGHENKHYAAMKFFIFTQVTGLLMLLARNYIWLIAIAFVIAGGVAVHLLAAGMRHVVVNGVVTLADGDFTGERTEGWRGRQRRRARPVRHGRGGALPNRRRDLSRVDDHRGLPRRPCAGRLGADGALALSQSRRHGAAGR